MALQLLQPSQNCIDTCSTPRGSADPVERIEDLRTSLDQLVKDVKSGKSTNRDAHARRLLADITSYMGSIKKGMATPVTSPEAMTALALQGMGCGPVAAQMQRLLGPNWTNYMEEIERVSSTDTAELEKSTHQAEIESTILERLNGIVKFWKELQSLKRDGTLDRFSESWAAYPREIHEQGLLQASHDLPQSSVSHIEEWAHGSKSQGSNTPHFSPQLNVEDLSLELTLPNLLNTRASHHPVHFYSSDGSLAAFRHFSGSLATCRTQGVLRIEVDENNEYYRVGFQRNISMTDVHPRTRSAHIALSECGAQLSTYNFLASFPAFFLDYCNRMHPHDIATSVTDSSIIGHYARDASGKFDSIDLEDIKSLVTTAAEETQNHFIRLRKDPEYWFACITQTSQAAKGTRTSNFLYQIFGSIQNWATLESDLRKFEQSKWSEAEFGNTESVSHQAFRHLAYVNCGFHAIMNEKLAFFSKLSWRPPSEGSSTTLRQVLNEMRKNSPIIRLMGVSTVLRALDRELCEVVATVQVPSLMGKALFDLSIAAIGWEATSKFYSFFPSNIRNMNDFLADREEEWKTAQRPWISLIGSALKEMESDRTLEELDSFICRESLTTAHRHHRFWIAVDKHINVLEGAELVSDLFSSHELACPTPSESTPLAVDYQIALEDTPTRTQTKKAKSQKHTEPNHRSAPRTKPLTISSNQRTSSERVIPTKPEFAKCWQRLLHSKSTQKWKDWVTAMGSLGYEMSTLPGAAHVFLIKVGPGREQARQQAREQGLPLHISFHKPHKDKVNRQEVKSEWLGRFQHHGIQFELGAASSS